MTNKIILFTILLILGSCINKNSSSTNKINGLFINDSIMTNKAQSKILSVGKEAIPYLIEHIDDKKQVCILTFLNPQISNIPKFLCNNYIGIRYAYLIEFVLSNDSLLHYNEMEYKFDEWEDYIKPYRLFEYGIIIKNENINSPKGLNYNDIVKLKEIYKDWWKKNENKPIEELRDEYKKGHKILKLPYVWI